MRLYPWSFVRRLDPVTMTFIYTVTYESNFQGALTAEKLAVEPEAELALLRELSEGLINHIALEMERHHATAPDLLDRTTDG